MLYVLAFGNPYLNIDNLALKVADKLNHPKLKIVKCTSPEEISDYLDKDFYILDVVQDAKEVILIEDIDKLQGNGIVTLHDFDLGFFLKLMRTMGQIDKIKIIGIPQKGDIESIKEKVMGLLEEKLA